MEVVEKKNMMLLSPSPEKCQECAVVHEPDQPHNAQSLYYQTKFYMAHKRSATWMDAMKHCSKKVKKEWIQQLEKMKVDVKGGKINPSR